jgi:NAD(P)-dependent dehydrogenase (short-subunit alcohol dehydrogenase family)
MKASFDAAGDVIAVTGGANGIGRALALAAARAGARVVVFDMDEVAMASLRSGNPTIIARRLDVADRDAVFACFAEVERTIGAVDGLVCAAAIQPRTNIREMDPREWDKVIAVNLNGGMWCYQAVVGSMIRRRKGSVIAFTSGLAHQGWSKASANAATKGALTAWVKSAAKEVAEYRVCVNLIAPGVIDTPQYRAANAGADDASWKSSLGVGSPEDVVGPLMFLLSDAATMTASTLSRDMAYRRDEDVE